MLPQVSSIELASSPSSLESDFTPGEWSPSLIDYENIPTPERITQEELAQLKYILGACTTLSPPSPRPLSLLPPPEDAHLENQKNIPLVPEAPVQQIPHCPIYRNLRQPECLVYTHPHQYLTLHTLNGVEERPL